MKTTWRLYFAAALLPVTGVAQAAGYLDSAMRSPVSFDEALTARSIELVAMLEPDLADPPSAPPAPGAAPKAAAPAPSSTVEGSMDAASMSDCGCDAGCGDACCGDACGCCPTWTVRAGAVILERARPRGQRIIEDRTGAPNRDGFADAFDFGFEGGPDVTITRWLRNGKGIEVRYFGALQWDAQATFTSDTGWAIPTNPPRTGTGIANVAGNYISRLDSTEVNYREAPNDRIAWLAGFRWIEVHETLGVNADFGGNLSDVSWDTNNHLYGGQLGAEVMLLDRGGPIALTSWFKGGLYGNDADNNFSLAQAVGPDVSTTSEHGTAAFVGDIAFLGKYRLSNNVSLNSGYQLLWIDGVALASEQIFATNILTGQGIDTTGFVFYHGALISMDVTW